MSDPGSSEPVVFLIEDNPADILLMQEALDECPLKVALITAHDGEEALAMLRRPDFAPDLVILDLHLPKLSGMEVMERYDPKTAPVIVFSSNCSEPDAQRALALGANECIAKPSDLKCFVEEVCAMLERWAPLRTR